MLELFLFVSLNIAMAFVNMHIFSLTFFLGGGGGGGDLISIAYCLFFH